MTAKGGAATSDGTECAECRRLDAKVAWTNTFELTDYRNRRIHTMWRNRRDAHRATHREGGA